MFTRSMPTHSRSWVFPDWLPTIVRSIAGGRLVSAYLLYFHWLPLSSRCLTTAFPARRATCRLTAWISGRPSLAGQLHRALGKNCLCLGFHCLSVPKTVTALPRTEVLHTLNAACGMGYVHPNAALRVRTKLPFVEDLPLPFFH